MRSGCALDASSIARASIESIAIRASVITCLPLASASSTMMRCVYGHVPMHTAFVSGSAIASVQCSYTLGMPYSSAMRLPDSRVRLATPTISTPFMAWNPGMCRSLVFAPAPIRAIEILSSAMGSS